MSKKSRTEKERGLIQEVINHLELHKREYGYVATDAHGFYAYTISPKDCNVCNSVYSIADPNIQYHFISRDEIITSMFKFPEIYKIEEAIIILKRRIIDMNYEETPVNKLFKLLSEVQGVEIKPYDIFEIKDVNGIIYGTCYFDENFKRYYSNGIREYNEDTLRGILTGEMKILKCKKAVVLTEDDIICLRYYLKNGYKYITNNVYFDGIMKYRIKGFKEEPKLTQNNNHWNYTGYNPYRNVLDIEDGLSFIHYDYPEIWDIEELLEQERVSND